MVLHVPQSLSGLDHATFDARLVQTWQPGFPWTQSTLPADPAISTTDFVEWTKAQLAEALSGDARLRGYDFRREAFAYVAFELARWSLHTVHLRQMDIGKLAEKLRQDFSRCLQDGELLTADERSPLYGQGRVQERHGGSKLCTLPITSRFDRNLLQVVAGGTPEEPKFTAQRRVEEWLKKDSLTYLSTLDSGSITVLQGEWRLKMWNHLDHVTGLALSDEAVLPAKTRDDMLEESIDAMTNAMPEPIVSAEMQRQVDEEVFRRRRAAELSALDLGKLRSMQTQRSGIVLMRVPAKEVLVKQLVDAEVRKAGGTLPAVPFLEQPIADKRPMNVFVTEALNKCLVPLLEQPPSPERDEKIRQRLVVPEFQMLICAQKMLTFLLEEEAKRPEPTEHFKLGGGETPLYSALPETEDIPEELASEMEHTSLALRSAHDVLMRAYNAIGVNYVQRPIAVILDFIICATSGRVDVRRQRSLI